MIQDDIISELQYIPESKLTELYNLIHAFRLGINDELAGCLSEYAPNYVPTEQAIQQTWQMVSGEKYYRS